MTRARVLLLALPLVAFGCSSNDDRPGDAGGSGSDSGGNGTDGAGPPDDGGAPTDGPPLASLDAGNVAPMIVDNGPPGAGGSSDVPFVSVTVCVPGTSTCQTIDHVSVDTGSTGLRILSSALTISLSQAMASNNQPLAECFSFADGYTWGSVRQADVKIAGEVAANIPIQIIGDPAFSTVPNGCSQLGQSEDTLADFGSNGLLGINQALVDCGTYCNTARVDGYYSCNGTACTDIGVPLANQLPNPIAKFTADNNGAILQFPAINPMGALTLSGVLVFGIGTQSNNGLGSASMLTVDDAGNFTTVYKGTTMNTSFLDSGTNSLAFDDSAIPMCSGQDSGFFCPPSTLSLSATNTGQNNVSTMVGFSVANTDALFNTPDSAFDDLAGPGLDANTFDWGFPFFIGRAIYVGFEGASTSGYFAY